MSGDTRWGDVLPEDEPANPSPAPEVLAKLAEVDRAADKAFSESSQGSIARRAIRARVYRDALRDALTALAAATREAERTAEVVDAARAWFVKRSAPLGQGRAYAECPVCHVTWNPGGGLFSAERHNLDCWIPRLTALAPRSPEGEGR